MQGSLQVIRRKTHTGSGDDIIQRAKDWHAVMALKKKRRFDTNKQYQKKILDQLVTSSSLLASR